jgi:4-hydroxy-2-oxoheptanedioate aldolase
MSTRFSLARRLRAGETVYSAWCRLAVPMIGEILARHGFAAVTFDLQHGLFDFATTVAGIGAVHAVDRRPSLEFRSATMPAQAGCSTREPRRSSRR